MKTVDMMRELEKELKARFPFFDTYKFNEFGAPILNGSSIFDMGLFLMFLEEAGQPAHSVALGRLLSVTKLTILNWRKKCETDALAVIDSEGSCQTAHYILRDWGVYSKTVYQPFQPYVRLVIQNWRKKENGTARI